MADNKNTKNKIWMYAVVLFMSAFVVLMLTAISQIKLNKNIMDYKSIIYNKDNEKSNFVNNLKSAEDNIKILKEEIKGLNAEVEKAKQQINDNNKKYEEKMEQEELRRAEYDKLLIANMDYQRGEYMSCAIKLLKNIEIEKLDSTAIEQYNYLKDKTFEKAAFSLYKEGYKEYINNNFESAKTNFSTSFELVNNKYYSDDCLFFAATSEKRLGNYQKAIDYCNLFIDKYPNSNLKDDVEKLLENIVKNQAR